MELILWRHCDAESGPPDALRRLTPRGRTQAERMARWLAPRLPDDCRILVSPAVRAQQTAQALRRPFQTVPELASGASVEAVLRVIDWPAAGGMTLIVGHEPTLGHVAAYLLPGDGERQSARQRCRRVACSSASTMGPARCSRWRSVPTRFPPSDTRVGCGTPVARSRPRGRRSVLRRLQRPSGTRVTRHAAQLPHAFGRPSPSAAGRGGCDARHAGLGCGLAHGPSLPEVGARRWAGRCSRSAWSAHAAAGVERPVAPARGPLKRAGTASRGSAARKSALRARGSRTAFAKRPVEILIRSTAFDSAASGRFACPSITCRRS